MPTIFPGDSFDEETLRLMTFALEEAWMGVGFALAIRDVDPTAIRARMAIRIMAAVHEGIGDPMRLKELALEVAKAC